MGKGLKITLISLGALVLLGIIAIMVIQNVMTSKIENILSNDLPENLELKYDQFDFSFIKGNFSLENPKLTSYGKNTDSIIMTVMTKEVVIDGINYWDYLFNDEVNLSNIIIKKADIKFSYNKVIKSESYTAKKPENLKKPIHIEKFQIDNSSFSMVNIENDSLMLELSNFNLKLSDIDIDNSVVNEAIPFKYNAYQISFDDFFYVLNDYENIEVKNVSISNEKINYKNLRLYTKYSKQKLSQMIAVERDHIDLTIDDVSIYDQEFGYHKDSIFYFISPKTELTTPTFNIYRNKLVNDDLKVKLMYSKMLRELNFDLTLSKVHLNNGIINYSEKVNPESPAGLISFKRLNADIKNLSNTYKDSVRTTIDIDGIFMESTPINVNWYFDVNNVNDYFIFKADIGRLPAQDLNEFSIPNLKIKMEGELSRTYFTIDGNFQNSNVDFKMNYEDFKVIILDKEGKDKNKFLSVVANLFIKKDSEKSTDGFREGSKNSVERDKTKSVFNFLWLNARAGLLSVMTGDGKK